MNGLNHNALTCSAVPIPPWERPLQTVEAQPYFNVSQASLVLEGIVFDRNNNLLFVDVATGRVFKLTPERQLSIVLKENSFGASGLAVHKDGRIFIASVGDMQRGSVRAIEPNGTREQMIVAPDTGFLVNDLVFDNQGGFYFTDSRGNSADPQGGVFYVSPNVGSIHAILPGLAVGNGIAIDPAGSQIWATEHAKNRLHRVRLSDATTVAPFGSVVTYQFTGPAPDGARVDSEGNVYVAISGQGRVSFLFNIANVMRESISSSNRKVYLVERSNNELIKTILRKVDCVFILTLTGQWINSCQYINNVSEKSQLCLISGSVPAILKNKPIHTIELNNYPQMLYANYFSHKYLESIVFNIVQSVI